MSDRTDFLQYRASLDGYSQLYTANGYSSFRRIEGIIDVTGTPKTQRVKPVEHVQLTYSGLPLENFWTAPDIRIQFEGSPLPWVGSAELAGIETFLIPHAERVKAAQEAFNYFAERFPTKISGAEFFQGIMELSALLPKLQSSLTRTLAGGYLNKKFGWDNLISDLRSFMSLAGSIRSRMEFLKRTYGKPTKLHFRKPNLGASPPSDWVWDNNRGWGWHVRVELESYQCDFNATCTLVQEMQHIDDFIGWLRAIVISLGLNNLATSIWKTTRLSFVVDWFVDISKTLTRLATIQPADKWDVYDISSSVSLVATFRVYQVAPFTPGGPETSVFLGHAKLKRYSRSIGLPLDLTLLTPSSLTPDQLVLLTAMGLSS